MTTGFLFFAAVPSRWAVPATTSAFHRLLFCPIVYHILWNAATGVFLFWDAHDFFYRRISDNRAYATAEKAIFGGPPAGTGGTDFVFLQGQARRRNVISLAIRPGGRLFVFCTASDRVRLLSSSPDRRAGTGLPAKNQRGGSAGTGLFY